MTNRLPGETMTPLKLAKLALDNWAANRDSTTLHVPHTTGAARIRLCPNHAGSPLGEVLCCPTMGGTTALFGSMEIVSFFVKQGLLKLTVLQSDGAPGKLVRLEEIAPPTPCANCGIKALDRDGLCLGCGEAR